MFDIQRFTAASDAADAVRLLREDPAAVLIAGGTDVLIRIREGKLPDAHLVSIHGLPELTGSFCDARKLCSRYRYFKRHIAQTARQCFEFFRGAVNRLFYAGKCRLVLNRSLCRCNYRITEFFRTLDRTRCYNSLSQ